MENSLETTTAKAVAGRFRNNMVGQPQMYIDILMITRRFTRGPGPADRRYSGAGHPQAPDEGGEVGAGAQPGWPQDSVYPVNSRQLWWNQAKASTRLVRLGYCFTPYQRLWLYNGTPFTTRWRYGGRILDLNPGALTGVHQAGWQVIELPDAYDEVADLAGTFERIRLGASRALDARALPGTGAEVSLRPLSSVRPG